MSAEWNAMSDEQKQKYKSLEQVDKERYLKEKVEWEKTNKTPAKPQKKKSSGKGGKGHVKEEVKASKAPINKSATHAPEQVEKLEGTPKRSTSAFFFYQAERRNGLKSE